MLRSILNIKRQGKIKTSEIKGRTKIRDIGYIIKKIKFKYAGHLVWGKDSWNKIVTEWTPMEYKRKRGRPLTRWRDKIEGEVGLLWHNAATLETDNGGLCPKMGRT